MQWIDNIVEEGFLRWKQTKTKTKSESGAGFYHMPFVIY